MVEILSSTACGPGSGPASPDRAEIAVADMAELIAAGEARPLLAELDVGPIFYGDTWWVVGGTSDPAGWFFSVADAEQQLELTASLLLLARTEEVVAEIAAARGRDKVADVVDDDVPGSWSG